MSRTLIGSKFGALLLAGGLLVACGGSDPDPVVPTATTPKPTPTPVQTTPPVQDSGDAILDGDRIKIARAIFYDVDKDTIRPESYPVLDAVAAVIRNHPEIKQLIVEGHTDDQGNVEHNRALSEKRANAVVRYLTQIGVPIPMQAPGYGATAPICMTTDEACRAINRRVEFRVKR
ncbi:MAG: OmpA family protein [Polyangiaceae bacterium]